MTTGERIRMVRLENGLTQKQVADACGMADSAIRKYESGKIIPKPDTLQRIAAALGVSIYMILDDEEKELYFEAEKSLVYANIKAGYRFTTGEKNIVNLFHKLNEDGKNVAIDRVCELTEIPRYRRQEPAEATLDSTEGKDTPTGQDAPEGAQEGE